MVRSEHSIYIKSHCLLTLVWGAKFTEFTNISQWWWKFGKHKLRWFRELGIWQTYNAQFLQLIHSQIKRDCIYHPPSTSLNRAPCRELGEKWRREQRVWPGNSVPVNAVTLKIPLLALPKPLCAQGAALQQTCKMFAKPANQAQYAISWHCSW